MYLSSRRLRFTERLCPKAPGGPSVAVAAAQRSGAERASEGSVNPHPAGGTCITNRCKPSSTRQDTSLRSWVWETVPELGVGNHAGGPSGPALPLPQGRNSAPCEGGRLHQQPHPMAPGSPALLGLPGWLGAPSLWVERACVPSTVRPEELRLYFKV